MALLRGAKLLVIALLAALPAAAAPAEPGSCFDDWSDAAAVVLEEQLLPTREVHEQARHRLPGDVVSIMLCQENQRFVYRLLMRNPQGRLNAVTIDARHPFSR